MVAALAAFAPIAAADPEDSDPDLAKRDQDYAAGKAAAERKEWAAAVSSTSARKSAIRITPTCRTASATRIAT
jgi:hypothetical protein